MQLSRGKRAVSVRTGDIENFKVNGKNYLKFIDGLRSDLSQPNVNYGNIRVTRTDNGITKVILKSNSTEIPFIYRNSDLYIVGFVVGSTFYADHDVFKWISPRETVGKLPAKHAWRSVLGDVTVNTLSVPLSYNNILQGRRVPINKMGDSLKKLTEVGDRNKKSAIVKDHLVPFVVAFSEAVRFTVVATAVRDAFVKTGGELDMRTNVLQLAGAGGPTQRKDTRYDITWLTLNWGNLSQKVKVCYLDNQAPTPFKYCEEKLGLEKNQLNQLLAVATARSFPAARGKRDVQWFRFPAQQQVIDSVGRITSEGDLQGTSSSNPMTSITHQLDMVGSLHLITMGILYLSGRKMQCYEFEREVNAQEAQAIAVDLMEKINCVTGAESDFEQDMNLQRELYGALIRGSDIVKVMSGIVEQRLEKVDDAVKTINAELAKSRAEIPRDTAKSCF